MNKIYDEIKDLINKLYPNNHYNGSFGAQPDWVLYPIEDIVEKVSLEIIDKCDADITECEWERNHESCYTLSITIPQTNSKKHEDIVEILKKGRVSHVYIMFLELSVLGPYACINGWNKKFLDSSGDYDITRYDNLSVKECVKLVTLTENILKSNNIELLSHDFLHKPLEYLTGNTHSTKGSPSVYNCLFAE